MSKLLQGGRISKVREDVVKFTSSIQSDKKLAEAVIRINQAHVIMLMEQKIIQWTDGSKLLEALCKLKSVLNPKDMIEDIHMLVEEKVFELCGPEVGGNLHIAKSRNDQVATALRMELREEILNLIEGFTRLQEALLKAAQEYQNTIFPGYTHTQPAQPITFAHYLISIIDCLNRDIQRLEEAYNRVNLCPMGAGALATSSFPINRARVAELLGFDGIVENSLDAVGSRDFILETMSALAIASINISRLAQDLILWGSLDFGLIELPDEFSSTSSIMPQKKNPDVLEIIRARMGKVFGNFAAAFSMLRTLPSGYNLDFQEVTPCLWESIEVMKTSLEMLIGLITNVKVNESSIQKPHFSFLAATELANMLVKKHRVPFRDAHKIVGAVVRELTGKGLTFKDLSAGLLNNVAGSFGLSLKVKDEDIKMATDLEKVVKWHNARGGPSPSEVGRMLKARIENVASIRTRTSEMRSKIRNAHRKLRIIIKSYMNSSDESPKCLKD